MSETSSPLTNSTNTKLIRKIPTYEIIKRYNEAFNIDVAVFFKGIDYVSIHECGDTGFRFYQPFGVDGNGAFYEQLQQFDWYYMPWKWEHEQVFSRIKKTDTVLEIGCGPAYFIQKLQENGIACTGLELNQKTVNDARVKSLDVRNEMIQDHATEFEEAYDVVCSFQVMEHIASIKEVLESSIKCLKKGGMLFISVPNNGSFLGLDDWNMLNMPPHHMGLWDKKNLSSLVKIFPIQLNNIYLEKLQEHHFTYFSRVVNQHIYDCFKNKYGSLLGRIMNKFFKNRSKEKLEISLPELNSFTIIAEFTKL